MRWQLFASVLCLLILTCLLPHLQLGISYGLTSYEGFGTYQLSGRKIDLYTQKEPISGKGPNQASDTFAPDEEVILYANVTYNDGPVRSRIVVFEVNGPINHVENISFIKSTLTEANGLANVRFRIPQLSGNAKEVVFGFWNVSATVEIAQVQVKDTLSFQVGWIVEILSIETTDAANASKTSFRKDEQIHFRVKVKNNAQTNKVATVVISAFDKVNASIGTVNLKDMTIPQGVTSYLSEGLSIPDWAVIGSATAQGAAYTALPAQGGAPLSPAVSTTFEISPPPPPRPPTVELFWLLLLILLIALAALLLGLFILRRRRKKKSPPSEYASASPIKLYKIKLSKSSEKRTKSVQKTRSSYICPHCGLYHLPSRE